MTLQSSGAIKMKLTYLPSLFMIFAVVAVGLGINGYRYAHIYGSASAIHHAEPQIETQLPVVGPIRNLRFTLFSGGIRPGEIRIKAGLVNIHVEDRTEISQGLIIQRILATDRVAVGTVQKVADQLRGRSTFRLTPGEYELIDMAQPANKAVLLVEP
jgi:hypothetical protein